MPFAGISWGNSLRKATMDDGYIDPIYETEKKIKRHKTFVRYLKLTMKYMFSHVGLCILLSIYCVLGCAIFMGIDGANEQKVLADGREYIKNEVDVGKEQLKAWLKNITRDPRCCGWENNNDLRDEIKRRLDDWQSKVAVSIQNFSYDGISADNLQPKWNYPATLLFVVTTITTIGYGNITPKTELSRLLLIAYALLGIPLMLMFLANIGDVLASTIRFLYGRGCCYFCYKKRNVRHRKRPEDGIELVDNPDFKASYDEEYRDPLAETMNKHGNLEVLLNNNREHIAVPMSLTACLLILYILLGAAFFKYHEGWPYWTCCYFCFVTLATVGFGDYIPGWNDMSTLEGKLLLAASALYIVLGMSFQAMGFNLVVDEFVSRAKNAAYKLGLMQENAKRRKSCCNLEDYVRRQIARP